MLNRTLYLGIVKLLSCFAKLVCNFAGFQALIQYQLQHFAVSARNSLQVLVWLCFSSYAASQN